MILILTPLAAERKALASRLGARGILLATGGHGKVQFALSAQKLIFEHKPELVICAGAAGSLIPEVKTGDVVVGECTVEHDFNLHFLTRPLPRFMGDHSTLQKIRKQPDPVDFSLHLGAIASGDEDVHDAARAREIQIKTGALAVAWEGAGGARACQLHATPFLEMRVITDAADAAAIASFRDNLERGMHNLARVLERLVTGH